MKLRLVVLLAASSMAAQEGPKVCFRASGSGSIATAGPEHSARLAAALKAIVESCSVDATRWAAGQKAWAKALSGAFARARYQKAETIRVHGQELSAQDILLPLPGGGMPEHIHVRTSEGFRAFTKFTPFALAAVICDDRPGLLGDQQYHQFCKVMNQAANERVNRSVPPVTRAACAPVRPAG